jgi:hypothetical protein
MYCIRYALWTQSLVIWMYDALLAVNFQKLRRASSVAKSRRPAKSTLHDREQQKQWQHQGTSVTAEPADLRNTYPCQQSTQQRQFLWNKADDLGVGADTTGQLLV